MWQYGAKRKLHEAKTVMGQLERFVEQSRKAAEKNKALHELYFPHPIPGKFKKKV